MLGGVIRRGLGGCNTSGWATGVSIGSVAGLGGEFSDWRIANSLFALHFAHPPIFIALGLSRSEIKLASLASTELAVLLITSNSPLSSQFCREHLQAFESRVSAPQLWALATELTLRRQAVSRPILNCVFFMRIYLCGPCDGSWWQADNFCAS